MACSQILHRKKIGHLAIQNDLGLNPDVLIQRLISSIKDFLK